MITATEHPPIKAEITRCLWFGAHWDREVMSTLDGRALEVLSPGWWNIEDGADFIRAELLMGSRRIVGDVIVRSHASDLPDVIPSSVVLVVVFYKDVRRELPVPCLLLSDFVEEDMRELLAIVK